ncbi:hypothetical protein PPYR_00417 [Photinus pyralis]|uniref:Metaxin glutathione S-transferase domain-containing protein n=1 Tax=Photinus pyralis TaxID=7054 RepID=A0A5N4B1H0_PHOPY|nr:metaxin-1 homolog [Photinus pyralis]KAB0803447.1 hypothetical protein PPYR_00417 [Photinus pyralis]
MYLGNDPEYPTSYTRPPITIRVWPGDYGAPSVDPTSLIVLTVCKMHKVPVKIVPAFFPFLVDIPSIEERNLLIVDKEKILDYVFQLCHEESLLNARQRRKLRAYKQYFMQHFGGPFYFDCWIHETNFTHAIETWFTRVIPFPFNLLYLHQKRKLAQNEFNLVKRTSEADTFMSSKYEGAAVCLGDFDYLLKDDRKFLYKNIPTSLDAIVYSYLVIAMNMPLQNPKLQQFIYRHKWLVNYVHRITKEYFPNTSYQFQYVDPVYAPYDRVSTKCLIIFGMCVTILMALYAHTNGIFKLKKD